MEVKISHSLHQRRRASARGELMLQDAPACLDVERNQEEECSLLSNSLVSSSSAIFLTGSGSSVLKLPLIIQRNTSMVIKLKWLHSLPNRQKSDRIFEDYPSNDDYFLNLLNSEYPFKDLNIASFSVEQANKYLDEAIARAVDALKDTVPIWREIKQ
uniref:Uncharacterized protein n=1 Tax=Ditylenchus dipsaci TaxID=166011 RepID=A0A915EJM7_9BILA